MLFYKNCVDIYYSIFGEDRKSRKSLYLVGFFRIRQNENITAKPLKTSVKSCQLVAN